MHARWVVKLESLTNTLNHLTKPCMSGITLVPLMPDLNDLDLWDFNRQFMQ